MGGFKAGPLGNEWYFNIKESDMSDEKKMGPVKTVTRKEIVPGQYGSLCVEYGVLGLSITAYFDSPTSEEIREAAHTLNQIAEAMEESK